MGIFGQQMVAFKHYLTEVIEHTTVKYVVAGCIRVNFTKLIISHN